MKLHYFADTRTHATRYWRSVDLVTDVAVAIDRLEKTGITVFEWYVQDEQGKVIKQG